MIPPVGIVSSNHIIRQDASQFSFPFTVLGDLDDAFGEIRVSVPPVSSCMARAISEPGQHELQYANCTHGVSSSKAAAEIYQGSKLAQKSLRTRVQVTAQPFVS